MKQRIVKMLTSTRAKKIYIGLALFVLLFVLCNDFIMPWYVNQRSEIEVPSVIGKKFEDAKRVLDSLKLEVREGGVRTDREAPPGTVINQNPIAGRKVNEGRRIYLTISGGEPSVIVPNLKGRTLRDAKFQLERDGLKLGAVEYQPSDDFPENTIIGQKVKAGAEVKRDVYISVIMSQGRVADKVVVPDVKGKTLKEAEQILSAQGLKLGNVTYQPLPDLLPNTVVDQFPREGELVLRGQAVDLFIVQGAEKKQDVLEN